MVIFNGFPSRPRIRLFLSVFTAGKSKFPASALVVLSFACRAGHMTCFHKANISSSPDAFSVDGVRRLEDLGVTDAIVGFRNAYVVGPDAEPLEQKIAQLERFADEVIAKT